MRINILALLPFLLVVGSLRAQELTPKQIQAQKADTTATEPKSPFLWVKGNSSIRVGGFARIVTSYDFDGMISSNEFIPASIDVPGSWDRDSRFGLDASTSRLSLMFVQKTNKIGDLKFYFESDFGGASAVLRLRQAYISLLGLTIGQTWSTMVDMAANAPTIDIQGVNSRTFCRTPQIRYTHDIGNRWTFTAAVEFPKVKISADPTLTPNLRGVAQRIPDVPLFVQYKGKNGHLRLTGILRGLDYGLVSQKKIETKLGWGFQLGGSLNPTRILTLYAQGVYGRGIARYINDLASLDLDLVPDAGRDGMRAQQMYGVSVGARVDVCPRVYLASSFSIAGIRQWSGQGDDHYEASEYRTGNYFSFMALWNAYKNLTLGAEYLNGYRKNMDNQSSGANRIQIMLRYDF